MDERKAHHNFKEADCPTAGKNGEDKILGKIQRLFPRLFALLYYPPYFLELLVSYILPCNGGEVFCVNSLSIKVPPLKGIVIGIFC